MKIGILTYHRALNYGAFLQTLALKFFLEQQGHEAEIIDYMPYNHAKAYYPFYISERMDKRNYGKVTLYNILRLPKYMHRLRKMMRLQHKYLKLDTHIKYTDGEQLSNLNYDCVVYGSDQIWWRHSPIPSYSYFDGVFWGEYINENIKKVTYAPSMGLINLDDEDKQYIKNALKRFSALSVRETTLKDVLQPLTDKSITVVLDPVLLVGKEFWNQYATRRTPKQKYVLLYQVMPSDEAVLFAKKKAKEMNCRYIELTAAVNPLKVGQRYIQTADAFDMISLIKNAEFVVSTSFHGLAFSILFEKQFAVMGMKNNSGRAASLLAQLGLIDKLDSSNENIIDDYSTIREKLHNIQTQSKNFIMNALSE